MYKQVFDQHSKLLKALAHPKRLEIIHLLRGQELNVTEIQKMLGLSQPNLSQHLQLLKQSEVLTSRKDGKQVFYKLSHKNFIKASDLFREVLIDRSANQEIADEFTLRMTDLVPLTHDPVCKMRLSPKTAGFALKHANKNYFFCAEGCLEKFKKNPNKYTLKGQK